MLLAMLLCTAQVLSDRPAIDTKFAQVAPVVRAAAPFVKSEDRTRAIVLVHGLRAHPFSIGNVSRAVWHDWQKSDSAMVKALAKEGDVYAFAYSQNVAVERISAESDLVDGIHTLKKMGYAEIVLVGHSAGGVVARHFVEDHPEAGVTKLILVCAPNGGTRWGRATFSVRDAQEAFVRSLSKEMRKSCLAARTDKKIPKDVEVVCVVGQVKLPGEFSFSIKVGDRNKITIDSSDWRGDGLVSALAQWPADFQEQGIPVVLLHTTHFTVMDSRSAARRIAELVRESHPRWNAERVAKERERILGSGGP